MRSKVSFAKAFKKGSSLSGGVLRVENKPQSRVEPRKIGISSTLACM
jgi:hypothetical protein